MREEVRELIRMLQSIGRCNDIRIACKLFQHEIDAIDKKCSYDFKDELINNLNHLLIALENKQ